MQKGFKRPKSKTELDEREAAGFWKAIALANEIGLGDEKISLDVILRIHKTMLGFSQPELAGRFRKDGEDVKKLECIEPPPGRLVAEQIYEMWRELDGRLAQIGRHSTTLNVKRKKEWLDKVIDTAAWAQHKLVAIHPFGEGNGRTARLLINVILRRYGLPPSQVRFEGENKKDYLQALCQVDNYEDYDPLKHLILRGVIDVYKREEKWRIKNKKKKA